MYIKVRVKTSQKEDIFTKTGTDEYTISVREKAERNSANKKIISLIKENLGVARVRIVSGHHQAHKIVEVE